MAVNFSVAKQVENTSIWALPIPLDADITKYQFEGYKVLGTFTTERFNLNIIAEQDDMEDIITFVKNIPELMKDPIPKPTFSAWDWLSPAVDKKTPIDEYEKAKIKKLLILKKVEQK